MQKSKSFKPKAHILTLLGEELIKSPVMAMYELIKNSYDADAKSVRITFENAEKPEMTTISILDDGTGMTDKIIEDVWLEPGTDFRKPIDDKGNRKITISEYFERVPMGEKGIGRFAVHKLSNKISVTTRPLLSGVLNKASLSIEEKVIADYEIELTIDWSKFGQHTYLDDLNIEWTIKNNNENFYFKDTHGTLIKLCEVKEPWTRGMARNLKRNISSMASGKQSNSSFKIHLDFNNTWLEDIPTVEEILRDAPFKFNAKVDSNYNLSYSYLFKLKNQKKIGSRSIDKLSESSLNLKPTIEEKYREKLIEDNINEKLANKLINKFSNNKSPIGEVEMELYSFNLDSISLKDSISSSNIKTILKDNAGIKVYKDNMRVFNYGEPGNDWLGLDIKRINSKEFISNNQNIGYITLNAAQSVSLIEKTNREGFIEDYNYELFKTIILEILQEFSATRWTDRQKWLEFNKKISSSPVEGEFDKLNEFVKKMKYINSKDKKYIKDKVDYFKKEYEEQRKTLLIPAGIGMTASVALHEIEKLVPRMESNLNQKPLPQKKLKSNVNELKQYMSGIMSILRKNTKQNNNLFECTERAFDNYELKMEARNIQYSIDIDEKIVIKCDKRLLVTMIMNLIDNSIHWLSTIYQDNKNIMIKAIENKDRIHLIFADNGPGFRDEDPVTDLVKPYFTRRSDGIGLGLYLIDTIMIQYGRLNLFHNKHDVDSYTVPDLYSGAIVELIFKSRS